MIDSVKYVVRSLIFGMVCLSENTLCDVVIRAVFLRASALHYMNAPYFQLSFFCFCFKAASMNFRNKGWGAVGRDLNSGWNWQPRNQG